MGRLDVGSAVGLLAAYRPCCVRHRHTASPLHPSAPYLQRVLSRCPAASNDLPTTGAAETKGSSAQAHRCSSDCTGSPAIQQSDLAPECKPCPSFGFWTARASSLSTPGPHCPTAGPSQRESPWCGSHSRRGRMTMSGMGYEVEGRAQGVRPRRVSSGCA